MSISAVNESDLSGGALKNGSTCLRSSAMSRLARKAREVVDERLLRLFVDNVNRREPVGVLGRLVLELELACVRKEHVDDDTLGGGEQDLVDQFLALVVAGIGADQLHLRARQRHVEDARVGGVGEVEAHDLAPLGFERKVRLAGDEHHVAEASHRHVRRLRLAEGGDLAVLDQDVVEGEQAARGSPAASSRIRSGWRGCSRTGPSPGRSPRGCAGGTRRRRGRARAPGR